MDRNTFKHLHYYIILIFINLSIIEIYSQNYNSETTIYKVEEIQKQKKAYIIRVYNKIENHRHIIVSLKEKDKEKRRKKIKEGKEYKMHLDKYFEKDRIIELGRALIVEIEGEEIIVRHNLWTGNIYTTPNLKGLYYIPCK